MTTWITGRRCTGFKWSQMLQGGTSISHIWSVIVASILDVNLTRKSRLQDDPIDIFHSALRVKLYVGLRTIKPNDELSPRCLDKSDQLRDILTWSRPLMDSQSYLGWQEFTTHLNGHRIARWKIRNRKKLPALLTEKRWRGSIGCAALRYFTESRYYVSCIYLRGKIR